MSSLAPVEVAQLPSSNQPLSADELHRMDAYWRAANYLSVGQIYLLENPLLREALKIEHVKPRLLGHWAPLPGSISSTFISTGIFYIHEHGDDMREIANWTWPY